MPRFPRPFTLLVLLACGPTLTGCQGWRTVDMPWPQAVASAADSLVVWGASSSLANLTGQRVNIAGRDVTSVAIRGTDAGKTAALVIAAVAFAGLLIAGASADYGFGDAGQLLTYRVPRLPD